MPNVDKDWCKDKQQQAFRLRQMHAKVLEVAGLSLIASRMFWLIASKLARLPQASQHRSVFDAQPNTSIIKWRYHVHGRSLNDGSAHDLPECHTSLRHLAILMEGPNLLLDFPARSPPTSVVPWAAKVYGFYTYTYSYSYCFSFSFSFSFSYSREGRGQAKEGFLGLFIFQYISTFTFSFISNLGFIFKKLANNDSILFWLHL